ncbi:MAG: hypothetical protein IT425_10465 [Pirellulales bacterium]|nr:hypothetical protein [Pirellulales bacterium]
MTISLNDEVDRQLQEKLASGMYESINHLISAALLALNHEEQSVAAILESNAEYEAGRVSSWDEADKDFRQVKGLPFPQ